jgi:hypothetical protein
MGQMPNSTLAEKFRRTDLHTLAYRDRRDMFGLTVLCVLAAPHRQGGSALSAVLPPTNGRQ